jgi:hypothetical protein
MLTGARAVHGARRRFAYVLALAFPERGYLAARDASYTRRLSRAARAAWPGRARTNRDHDDTPVAPVAGGGER